MFFRQVRIPGEPKSDKAIETTMIIEVINTKKGDQGKKPFALDHQIGKGDQRTDGASLTQRARICTCNDTSEAIRCAEV